MTSCHAFLFTHNLPELNSVSHSVSAFFFLIPEKDVITILRDGANIHIRY